MNETAVCRYCGAPLVDGSIYVWGTVGHAGHLAFASHKKYKMLKESFWGID